MRLLLLILHSITVLSANTIDAQIEAIRKAPVAKRFELMNAFKRQLVRMHEKERIQAIHKLKNITRSKHSNRAIREIKTHWRTISRNKHQDIKKHIQQEIDNHLNQTVDREIENHIEEEVENEIENQLEGGHNND